MDVVDCWDQLLEIFASNFFFKSLVGHDQVKELSSLCIFHYQVEVLVSLDDFIELYYIGVVYLFKNFDFSWNSFNIFLIFNFTFFKDLNSNL